MSSPSAAAALVRTASEEERERKQQAEAEVISSLDEVREAETELADVQQQILALSPREEGKCSAASTPARIRELWRRQGHILPVRAFGSQRQARVQNSEQRTKCRLLIKRSTVPRCKR